MLFLAIHSTVACFAGAWKASRKQAVKHQRSVSDKWKNDPYVLWMVVFLIPEWTSCTHLHHLLHPYESWHWPVLSSSNGQVIGPHQIPILPSPLLLYGAFVPKTQLIAEQRSQSKFVADYPCLFDQRVNDACTHLQHIFCIPTKLDIDQFSAAVMARLLPRQIPVLPSPHSCPKDALIAEQIHVRLSST